MKPSTVVVYNRPANFSFSDLMPGMNGDGEELLVYVAVKVEDLEHFDIGFLLGKMRSVIHLP